MYLNFRTNIAPFPVDEKITRKRNIVSSRTERPIRTFCVTIRRGRGGHDQQLNISNWVETLTKRAFKF